MPFQNTYTIFYTLWIDFFYILTSLFLCVFHVKIFAESIIYKYICFDKCHYYTRNRRVLIFCFCFFLKLFELNYYLESYKHIYFPYYFKIFQLLWFLWLRFTWCENAIEKVDAKTWCKNMMQKHNASMVMQNHNAKP